MSLIHRTAVDLLDDLSSVQVTSAEVTRAFLDRIDEVDSRVRAFLRVEHDAAMAQAESVDRRRAAGEQLGALAGLPVALKDVVCVAGAPTTCGSKILEQFVPPYDATVVAKLRAADAVLIGKTNMDEFAMGSSNENSAYFPTRNPWDLSMIPGGSSGGSAACVAASMAPLAIGSDTGGSIRQPAALCGTVGLKPTYGRVSRYGLVAFASSLDQLGPLASTAADAALLLTVIAGHDPRDETSANREAPNYLNSIDQAPPSLRIGVVREQFGEGLDAQIKAAVEESLRVFKSRGAEIVDVELPHSRYAIATYYIIAPSEASSNLARYDGAHYGYRANEAELRRELNEEREQLEAADDQEGLKQLDSLLARMYRKTRSEGLGAEVKRRIMIGAYALSAGYYDKYYLKALQVRRLIRNDFDEAFQQVDLIVGPSTPTPAFPIGEKADDPLAMYLGDLYTVSANLAGITGASIPCGATSTGLPIGLQLQAPRFGEERLLQAAHLFQQATDWHTRKPELS